jgi:titin
MSLQTVTFGSAQYNSWTAGASGEDVTSTWDISDDITTTEAPTTGAIGTYYLGANPLRMTTFTLYWWADANPTTSTLDFQIATAASGSGGYQSGATNANGSSTALTPNYLSHQGAVVYYGFQKNDSGNIRFNTATSSGNTTYINGTESTAWAGRRIYGRIVSETLPNAPTGVVGTTINSTAVSLSWTIPTDNGGIAINGYRILKRLHSASANANTDWSVAVSDTGSTTNTRTITGLLPGTAYRFIVAALNPVSDALVTESGTAYTSMNAHTGTRSAVSGYVNTAGGVYTTAWLASPNIMTYNGTAWVKANIRVYDGTTWDAWGS